MAKGKKEKLSLEELLEEAIVKEEDRPYEVLGNWVWTRLGNAIGFPKDKFTPSDNGLEVKYVGLEHLEKNQGLIAVGSSKDVTSTKNVFKANDIIYGRLRPYLNKHDVVNFTGICSTDILVFRCLESISTSKFINYYLNTDIVIEYAVANSKGINLPRVSEKELSEVIIPIPPLPEQQRIVEVIESLFEKLDAAKELVQNALDSFENRKAAILHKAFTGELTAKWREENGVNLDSWDEKPLKNIAQFRSGYAFDSKKFINEGYQVVRMGNLYNGVLDLSRNPVFYLKSDIDEITLRKSKINNGDILLTLTGTKYKRDYGYAVLVETDKTILLNQRIVSLTPKSVETKYLLNYLKTNLFRDIFFSNETGGVNQGNVSSKFVENISIPLPTHVEQKEIVRILDNLLENEQRAKELSDVIEKIDLMKKAILARAFRGELGTNNPEEESVVELLREVLKERI